MRPPRPPRRSASARPRWALDVRDAEACRAAATAAISRSGSLDLWVNNAGVLITGNAWEQDEAARQTMVDVNAVGTMNGTVAALERMTGSAAAT